MDRGDGLYVPWVAFLSCWFLTAGRSQGARQSLTPPLQKPVGDSLHNKFSLGSFVFSHLEIWGPS